MSADWERTTVGELVKRGILEKPLDGNHGSTHPKGEDFVASGVPFIMASDLVGGGIDTVGCSFITLDQAKTLRKGFAKTGDVLLSHKATLGRTAIVGATTGDFVMLTPQVTYYRPKDHLKLNNRYLKYYFDSEGFQQTLQAWGGGGSTRAYIGITEQLGLPITLPPLPEQKAIARILGTLDDKIELNRRMNATLEAMARALFQSWFVDFDPVHAKAAGRPPSGMNATTARLFPSAFQDSALGEIPEGWEVKTVKDIGKVVCGKTPPTSVSEYYGSDVPFITIPDMHGSIFAISTARKLSDAGASFQANKTIPPGSICVSCIATPGLVTITSEPSQTNQQINSVIPRERDQTYFWYWTLKGLGADIASGGSGGSVLVNLSKGRFEALNILTPPNALVRSYHAAVRPFFESILANTNQSRTLATLRDTLLPKLLAGELLTTGETK